MSIATKTRVSGQCSEENLGRVIPPREGHSTGKDSTISTGKKSDGKTAPVLHRLFPLFFTLHLLFYTALWKMIFFFHLSTTGSQGPPQRKNPVFGLEKGIFRLFHKFTASTTNTIFLYIPILFFPCFLNLIGNPQTKEWKPHANCL